MFLFAKTSLKGSRENFVSFSILTGLKMYNEIKYIKHKVKVKNPTIEKHIKCPYLKDCTNKAGFCHRHTTEAFVAVCRGTGCQL